MPDMLTFSADGRRLLVANEGEFNADRGLDRDPVGSVSVISLEDLDQITRRQIDFAAFDGFEDLAREQGIRLAPGRSMLRGLEPEYITISPDGDRAFVTLQEANTVAVLDLVRHRVVDLLPLGTVDHSLSGNELDPNDDGEINIELHGVPACGCRMRSPASRLAERPTSSPRTRVTAAATPAISPTAIRRGSETSSPVRVPGVILDPAVDITGLERLAVSTIDGDTDGDGDIDVLHSFGGRGFTIFAEDGTVVFESGSQFEQHHRRGGARAFQRQQRRAGRTPDAKGREPEAVAIGEINDALYAFIGLEGDSGIMVYNIPVTEPANATFVDYISGFESTTSAPRRSPSLPQATAPAASRRSPSRVKSRAASPSTSSRRRMTQRLPPEPR